MSLRPDSLSERRAPLPRPSLRSLISGAEILSELTGPAAVLLWEAYRSAHLWAAAPGPRRGELADPRAERVWVAEVVAAGLPELEPHLLALAPLFGDPAAAAPERLAPALRALASWCDERGHARAAALLAEAAAHAAPGDPGAVHHAGKAAKLAGWEAEAESWFRYGLTVARARGSQADRATFLGALGTYHHRRGNLRLSERLYLRALRAARRGGTAAQQGMMLHDLCLLLADRGRLAQAEAAAREAAALYGPHHPALPVLMHDLAYAWMLRGRFDAAYPLMEAALPHLPRPDHRVRAVANLARAAGARGDRDAFERAWAEVADTVRQREGDPSWADPLSDALREAAHGALSIGDPLRALWAVERAEPLAARAGRGMDRMQIDALRQAAEAARDRLGPAVAHAPARLLDAGHPEQDSVRVAAECVALLARRGGA